MAFHVIILSGGHGIHDDHECDIHAAEYIKELEAVGNGHKQAIGKVNSNLGKNTHKTIRGFLEAGIYTG